MSAGTVATIFELSWDVAVDSGIVVDRPGCALGKDPV